MSRIKAIDILRAVAIIGMIQVHFTENLSYYLDGESILARVSQELGSFPAPLFTFLVGMSLYISTARREQGGFTADQLADRNLRRGVAIFFIGLLHATLIWMPVEVFNWDILTLIGASLLMLFPLRRLADRWLIAAAAGLVLISPLLRIWSEYPNYWDVWGEYVNPFNLKGVLLGFIANGYFPLLPWLLFPLVGYLVAKSCFGRVNHRVPKSVPLSGLLLIVLAVAGVIGSEFYAGNVIWLEGYLSPYTFYPASTTFLLLALGLILLLFWALYSYFDQRNTGEGRFIIFCRRYSRYALSAYVIHHAVHVWPLLIAANMAGKRDHWFYYGEVMPTWASLSLAAVFTVLFYLIIIIWDKYNGKYSLEWLLTRLVGDDRK
jgi:uncharacterized membrane protein